jgi:hypothetical protein
MFESQMRDHEDQNEDQTLDICNCSKHKSTKDEMV